MKKKLLLIFTVIISIIFSSSGVLAQTIPVTVKQQQGWGIQAQGSSAEGIVQIIVLNVITLFFAVGGIGVVIYFIWGAVDWIMSSGDKEKVAAARKKMTNAIIGLVLLSLSYFIIRLVGEIVGFNPLGPLEIRSIGESK